jgi:Tol biopolymer transport system component
VLSKARSKGTLHLAPALSPDGSQVVFFSEKDFFFVDMWLANVSDGIAARRLFKSTWSSNYETFRFINSAANWSPDGKLLAFAAKRGPKDDIVVLDVARNKEVARLTVTLSGITSPSWSPDGKRLVFTGYDGGHSDLFVIDVNGKNLTRLTHDRYADLHPAWSPDGKTIAFTTDRGPGTNFELLTFGEFRLALYHLETDQIEMLAGMESGANVNPQWAPDGASLAYVSDRTGVANIFLYELASGESYQLTDFYTGAQGITPLSPILSWARASDKLAYVYYQGGDYDVYVMPNPRALKKVPWRLGVPLALADSAQAGGVARPPTAPPVAGGSALYRSASGLRRADSVAPLPDSLRPALPLSMAVLMDSAKLGLPDTVTFAQRDYGTDFSLDYAAQPTIGYTRDTFGRGVYGGATVTLSDMLGNKKLIFSGYINGRPDEAQLLAAYANIAHRVNWAVGLSQDPYFWYYGSGVLLSEDEQTAIYATQYRRLVYRSAFLQSSYPLSRFRRIEGGLRATNIEEGINQINQPFDPNTGYATGPTFNTRIGLGSNLIAQPSLALVFDNTLGGYVGPYLGRRSHFEISQSFGDWAYTEMTFDYRRYTKLKGPLILATRGFYFGRNGRDANRFTVFLGTPELLRGYTSGSYGRNECSVSQGDPNSPSGCSDIDQLVGTSVAVFNAELRFPILNNKIGVAPKVLPPIEGAIFYDVGMAWTEFSTLAWSRPPGASPLVVRTPLMSIGGSLRTNVFGIMILRFDYSKPVSRPGVRAYWTISLGPTF